MRIIFIVAAVIAATLYALINIFNHKVRRPRYDFSTDAQSSWIVFAHILSCVSFSALIIDIIISYFVSDKLALWVIFGFASVFAVLGLILLSCLYFNYEAIKGDCIYVHRFAKVKKLDVSAVHRVYSNPRIGAVFLDKNDKSLFSIEPYMLGIDEFMQRVYDGKYDCQSESAIQEVYAEEQAILTKIGREYRESYGARKKKTLIVLSVVGAALAAAIVLLYLFGIFDSLTAAFLGAFAAVGIVVFLCVGLFLMKQELNTTDELLGDKCRFSNKRVKGANKNAFKTARLLCCLIIAFGVVLLIPLFIITEVEPDYDEFTSVTGELEYGRTQGGKYAYIAIAICDIPTEYRLSSIYLDEFDYSFFNEVKAGDTVTILVDNYKDREFSLRGVSRNRWNNFYYLATESKEYFTYDDYVKCNESNNRVGYVMVGAGIVSIVASTVTLISYYFVCKKREKLEDIVIYK